MIREDHDVRNSQGTVAVAAIRDVNKRFLGIPVCLIEIESIFFHLAVESHQPFVVDTGTIAFHTMSRTEIKQVPNERTPDERTFRQCFPVSDMIISLVILRMPPTGSNPPFHGILLMVDARPCPIFADGNLILRMCLMIGIQPFPHIGRRTAIPTEILVPGYHISHLIYIIVVRKEAGRCCQASRVLLMGQVVQFLDILGRIVSDGLQLIEQPPETDRRMIIMLANQFFQLLFPVLPERRLVDVALVLVSARPDLRNFSPGDNSVFIHQVIKVSRLRIMSQTNGISPHLDHNGRIFIVMHFIKRISPFRPILVAAYSFQFQMFPIQKETFLGIHMIIAQA